MNNILTQRFYIIEMISKENFMPEYFYTYIFLLTNHDKMKLCFVMLSFIQSLGSQLNSKAVSQILKQSVK